MPGPRPNFAEPTNESCRVEEFLWNAAQGLTAASWKRLLLPCGPLHPRRFVEISQLLMCAGRVEMSKTDASKTSCLAGLPDVVLALASLCLPTMLTLNMPCPKPRPRKNYAQTQDSSGVCASKQYAHPWPVSVLLQLTASDTLAARLRSSSLDVQYLLWPPKTFLMSQAISPQRVDRTAPIFA